MIITKEWVYGSVLIIIVVVVVYFFVFSCYFEANRINSTTIDKNIFFFVLSTIGMQQKVK